MNIYNNISLSLFLSLSFFLCPCPCPCKSPCVHTCLCWLGYLYGMLSFKYVSLACVVLCCVVLCCVSFILYLHWLVSYHLLPPSLPPFLPEPYVFSHIPIFTASTLHFTFFIFFTTLFIYYSSCVSLYMFILLCVFSFYLFFSVLYFYLFFIIWRKKYDNGFISGTMFQEYIEYRFHTITLRRG